MRTVDENLIEMLAHYREYTARCGCIETDISDLKRMIASLQNSLAADMAAPHTAMTGMPHGSGISDPTARIGAMLASGYVPDDIRQLEDEIKTLEQELAEKSSKIRYVDSLLMALNEKQCFVLRRKGIDQLQWREIIYGYKKEFGIEYSRTGLKKIYKSALAKMQKIEKCPESVQKVSSL